MKIDGIKGRAVGKAESSKKSSKGKATSGASRSSLKPMGDEVEVSDHAATLDLIRSIVEETPDIRVDQVDRIVGELKGKKYKINFEKVAEGFIKEALMNEISRRPKGK